MMYAIWDASMSIHRVLLYNISRGYIVLGCVVIPAPCHTFVEIDHQIFSTTILLPSSDLRRVVVSYKRKYVHKVLVNRLVKLAQEKGVVR